jgi:hypothetical protein
VEINARYSWTGCFSFHLLLASRSLRLQRSFCLLPGNSFRMYRLLCPSAWHFGVRTLHLHLASVGHLQCEDDAERTTDCDQRYDDDDQCKARKPPAANRSFQLTNVFQKRIVNGRLLFQPIVTTT